MSLDSIESRIREIAIEFEKCHLVYLQIDDSPLKLDQRRKLEDLIQDYLCLVSSDRKFIFEETADILYKSATTCKDFSGYKAATGWSAIALYASNLLSQPWRKEYKSIRTYSGYFKHEVEANLVGAEVMFELMGYSHNNIGVLSLNGLIDPDKVSNVSRDAIVAFVECKIIKQIWEAVSNTFNVSWLEILEFRKNYAGAPELAIRALKYRYLERMNRYLIFESQFKPEELKYQEDNKNILTINQVQNLSYQKNNNYCHNFVYGIRDDCYQRDFNKSFLGASNLFYKCEGNHLNNIIRQSNDSIFSTERFMEDTVSNEKFNVNVPNTNKTLYNRKLPANINTHDLNNSHFSDNKLNTLQVSGKDQIHDVQIKPVKKDLTNIENFSNEIKITTDDKIVCNNAIEQSTVMENLITIKQSVNWNCNTCTYLNVQEHNICQMCGKSRQKGNEDEPLISGGKECPKCTLVNKKDVDICDACETNLNGSPTYI